MFYSIKQHNLYFIRKFFFLIFLIHFATKWFVFLYQTVSKILKGFWLQTTYIGLIVINVSLSCGLIKYFSCSTNS